MAVLVTGGARSGKSGFAERYAARLAGSGIYVATSQVYDEEMEARVRRHREDREGSGFRWETIEEPADVAGLLNRTAEAIAAGGRSDAPPVVLVDCLTLWLTNRLLAVDPDGSASRADVEQALDAACDALVQAAAAYPYPLVLVTNEVGGGLVPEYPLGRRFRDAAGRLNRRIAEVCERVFLVTAGIPVDLKAIAYRMEDV